MDASDGRTAKGAPMTTPTSQPDRRDPDQGVFALQWVPECDPQHVEAIETANRLFGCLRQALHRVYPASRVHPFSLHAVGAPLAVGGAMAVYKLTVQYDQHALPLVCKIPHQRRLVYTADADAQAQDDATSDLLDTLAHLADTVNRHAAGVFPRCGGAWHWRDEDDVPRHLLIEAFVPGVSVERLLLQYEQRLLAGELDADAYAQRRADAERLAVATYVRLWNALGRRRFTSDPSPWNVLVCDADAAGDGAGSATIIDLHSLQPKTPAFLTWCSASPPCTGCARRCWSGRCFPVLLRRWDRKKGGACCWTACRVWKPLPRRRAATSASIPYNRCCG